MDNQRHQYVTCTHCGHKMPSLFHFGETVEYFCHACDKQFIDDSRCDQSQIRLEATESIHEKYFYQIMSFISTHDLNDRSCYYDQKMEITSWGSLSGGVNNSIMATEIRGNDCLEITFNLHGHLAEEMAEIISSIRKEEESDKMWDEIDVMEDK